MGIINRVKEIVRTIRFSASPRLYGRSSSGAGNGEEIFIGSGLTLTGGVLAVSVAWSEITGKPATFAPSAHTHSISDVTNLQTALDGKAATSHNHPATIDPYPPSSPGEDKALGMLTVNSVPSAGSTITIDGHVFTFVTAGTPDSMLNIVVHGMMTTASVAAAIATAINRNYQTITVVGIVPPSQPNKCELISVLFGSVGNATTYSSSTAAVSCDGANLAFGVNVGSSTPGADASFIGQIRNASGHVFMCVSGGDGPSTWRRI